MIRKMGNSSSAFTLIEVLVAMLILAIGMLGLLGITILVFRNNLLSQQINEATNLNQALMEQLKSRVRVADETELDALNCIRAADNATELDADHYAVTQIEPDNCEILTTSGLDFTLFPAPVNGGGDSDNQCLVPQILGGDSGTWTTFDLVDAAGTVRTPGVTSGVGTDFCAMSQDLDRNQYVRYYRVWTNAATGTDKFLYSVVLWRDRFNKFRSVELQSLVIPLNSN